MNSVLQDRLVSGEYYQLLENTLRKSFETKNVSLLASPSSAVAEVVTGLGLVPGDSVLLSPLAPGYWQSGLESAGVDCRWVDVGRDSPVVNAAAVSSHLDENVKAIVLDTCLGYQPVYADFAGLAPFIINDFSQGLGGLQNNSPLWCFGDVLFTSFGSDSLLAGPGGCALAFRKKAELSAADGSRTPKPWELMPDVGASLIYSQWPDIAELAEGKRSNSRVLFQRLRKTYTQPRHEGDSLAIGPYFCVMVDSALKEVVSYSRKHAVEVDWAFREHSIRLDGASLDACPSAKRFVAHTLAFPLYSVFGNHELETLGKVLASLP